MKEEIVRGRRLDSDRMVIAFFGGAIVAYFAGIGVGTVVDSVWLGLSAAFALNMAVMGVGLAWAGRS